ncbi:MAG: P-loop NTPase [Atopobiaceae bacterium]|nr:P-loop NTPase [Atopobiaceae bacterium]
MCAMWLGLGAEEDRDGVRRALSSIDDMAQISFAGSAQEIRHWALEAERRVGAVIGPVEDAISPMNAAAALAKDGVAHPIMLVSNTLDKDLRLRAQKAGIDDVLPMVSEVVESEDLDEPDDAGAALPTLVFDEHVSPRNLLEAVPRIDTDAGDDDGDDITRIGPFPSRQESTRMEPHGSGGASAPIVTFVSGRGGVGKTSLTAVMAHAAASWGMRVALLDLDLSFGNLYSCFGIGAPSGLTRVAEGGLAGVDDVIACGTEAADGIWLWGPCELPELSELIIPHVGTMLTALSTRYDLVLVDTSTTVNDAVAQAIQQSDRLVIVVDGRPGSTVDQARIGALAVRLGVARTRVARLANRCGPRGRGEPDINRASLGLETARPLRVMDGGTEVIECLADGRVDELFALDSRFSESSAACLAQVLSELGSLPNDPAAHRLLEKPSLRSRWSFGRRKEAV